jgi:hypothetical protein
MVTKKLIFGALAGYLLSSTAASAQLVIQPIINTAPPVVAVQPYYAGAPYVVGFDPHHHWHNKDYWHHHHDEHWRR